MNRMRVGVVGLGRMGRGIAASFLGHGFHVTGFARDEAEHADARGHIERMLGEMVEHGVIGPEMKESWHQRFHPTTELEGLTDCGFAVESVIEDAAVKMAVFDELERVVGPQVVIASNTSAIPISVLQQSRQRPERFIGMHWAEPPYSTRFLELIRGEQTSDEAVRITEELSRQVSKDPCVCQKDIPGFIGNRIAYAMYREALHLVDLGVADFETIDRALRNSLGLWAASCGPFRWMDVSGGAALYAKVMQRIFPTLSNATDVPESLRSTLANAGRGPTEGQGLYEYPPEEAKRWEERQNKHTWLVKHWLDEEFPIDNGDAPSPSHKTKESC